jgi:hypothetical protein
MVLDLNPEIIKMIITQGVFCVLFVWLLYDTRKESKLREYKLMLHLEKTDEAHAVIIQSIEKIIN